MPRATTLVEAVRVFDPVRPLSDRELDEYYVPRGDALDEMATRLGVAREDEPAKLLLTGQRGCGKSTELNKLATRLDRQYFIVSFSVQRQKWPLAELTYVDVLLGVANTLFRRATDKDVLTKAPAQIVGDVLEDTRRFFESVLFGNLPYRAPAPDLELGAKVNLLAVELETKFSTEAKTREQIRDRLANQMSELIEKMDQIAEQVRLKYNRPVLIMVEDADKPEPSRARDIFLGHGETLTAPRLSMIYTFPLSLRYSIDFTAIRANFDESYFLPNLNLRHRNGAPNPDGEASLRNMVLKRLEESRIAPEALQILIEASGGLARILIRLVNRAAVRALARNRVTIIREDALTSIAKERDDLAAGLGDADWKTLVARRDDKEVLGGDPTTQALLHALALLEYRNSSAWCDVNSMLLPMLNEKYPPQ